MRSDGKTVVFTVICEHAYLLICFIACAGLILRHAGDTLPFPINYLGTALQVLVQTLIS
jgi:hypothetical protein